MAETYQLGVARLWYRSKGFKESLDVLGDLRGPNGFRDLQVIFMEEGDGLYFVDYHFFVTGSYVLLMYENGVKTTTQNFLVINPPSSHRVWIQGTNLLNTS